MTQIKRLGDFIPHVDFSALPPEPPKKNLVHTTASSFSQERIGWDKIDCTYWWVFYPDFSHKKWFKPIEEGKGYSKKHGNNEAKDKNLLLISKIIMLCTNEYIQSCRRVEIYKRPMNTPLHHTQDQLLVTFNDRGKVIQWDNFIYSNFPKDIVQHLLKIGEMIQEGKALDVQYYMPRKRPEAVLAQKVEDKNKLNFPTPEHVDSWAEYQVKKKGADFKTVSDFAAEYKRKNFPAQISQENDRSIERSGDRGL